MYRRRIGYNFESENESKYCNIFLIHKETNIPNSYIKIFQFS